MIINYFLMNTQHASIVYHYLKFTFITILLRSESKGWSVTDIPVNKTVGLGDGEGT